MMLRVNIVYVYVKHARRPGYLHSQVLEIQLSRMIYWSCANLSCGLHHAPAKSTPLHARAPRRCLKDGHSSPPNSILQDAGRQHCLWVEYLHFYPSTCIFLGGIRRVLSASRSLLRCGVYATRLMKKRTVVTAGRLSLGKWWIEGEISRGLHQYKTILLTSNVLIIRLVEIAPQTLSRPLKIVRQRK
jgi:hypothetical protein